MELFKFETSFFWEFWMDTSLKLTPRTWKYTRPQKERIVFQPSFFRGELLVSRRVDICFTSLAQKGDHLKTSQNSLLQTPLVIWLKQFSLGNPVMKFSFWGMESRGLCRWYSSDSSCKERVISVVVCKLIHLGDFTVLSPEYPFWKYSTRNADINGSKTLPICHEEDAI